MYFATLSMQYHTVIEAEENRLLSEKEKPLCGGKKSPVEWYWYHSPDDKKIKH
jgi:hypothetical protein